MIDCAKEWHHEAEDNNEDVGNVSWEDNSLYIGAYIGDEEILQDKKSVKKTNKALYNKTKHRFCRLTDEMVKALAADGVPNIRQIKLEIDDNSIEKLIESIILTAFASELLGGLVLRYHNSL